VGNAVFRKYDLLSLQRDSILFIFPLPLRRAGGGEDLPAKVERGELRRLAGNERLARGRRFPRIRRQVRIGGDQADVFQTHAERVGADLRQDGARALSDVRGAAIQSDLCIF